MIGEAVIDQRQTEFIDQFTGKITLVEPVLMAAVIHGDRLGIIIFRHENIFVGEIIKVLIDLIELVGIDMDQHPSREGNIIGLIMRKRIENGPGLDCSSIQNESFIINPPLISGFLSRIFSGR
jgi:hypothetical protein